LETVSIFLPILALNLATKWAHRTCGFGAAGDQQKGKACESSGLQHVRGPGEPALDVIQG
jgi:hypothetical protein